MDAEVVLDARAELGEGPVWDSREGVLRWVDIVPGLVHRFDPATGADTAFAFGEEVGTVAARADGGLVLGTRTGVWTCAADGSDRVHRHRIDTDPPGGRCNDGKADPWGRFWVGTMFEGTPGASALYRLGPGAAPVPVVTGVSVSNGLGWSPDGATMYFTDTETGGVDAFDHDPETGRIGRRRRFAEIDRGRPDGLTVDAEGGVWVALWGGWGVRHHAPDGRLVATLDLPVAQVTSCAFGGPDLATLYITSAATGLSDPDGQAHAGSLFACVPGVSGRPAGEWAG